MGDQFDLEAIKERIDHWAVRGVLDATTEVYQLIRLDLSACLAEIERLRTLVTDMQAIHADLRRDYAEQTADARRMSTKLDRIGEIMDE